MPVAKAAVEHIQIKLL